MSTHHEADRLAEKIKHLGHNVRHPNPNAAELRVAVDALAALAKQQATGVEFCCEHSWSAAKQLAWKERDLNCGCDHNESCLRCFPAEFRTGGRFHTYAPDTKPAQAASQPKQQASQEAQAEPVMIYHGDCTIDCGEHGHHHVELLKMIPAGAYLYTRPYVQSELDAAAAEGARLHAALIIDTPPSAPQAAGVGEQATGGEPVAWWCPTDDVPFIPNEYKQNNPRAFKRYSIPLSALRESLPAAELALTDHDHNLLESIANWLNSRSEAVWASRFGYGHLMKEWARDLRRIRARGVAENGELLEVAAWEPKLRKDGAKYATLTWPSVDPQEKTNG